MKLDYEKLEWDNYPSTDTPINADNLNRMEEGIAGMYSNLAGLQRYVQDAMNEAMDFFVTGHVTNPQSAVLVDDSLSVSGAAADAKVTGDELTDLKGAFDDELETIERKMQLVSPENWFDSADKVTGITSKAGVYDSTNTSYFTLSEPIKVSPGDVVRFYGRWNGGGFGSANCKFLCAYNSSGSAESASGSDSDIQSYTVPSGIYSIIPSFNKFYSDTAVTINSTASEYSEYFDPYYIAGDGFINNLDIDETTNFDEKYLDYTMVNRFDPEEAEIGYIIGANGTKTANSDYFISGYMPIRPGETLYAFYTEAYLHKNFRMFAAYDKSKNILTSQGSNTEVYSITQSGDMAYIRATFNYYTDHSRNPDYTAVFATDEPKYMPEYGNSPVIDSKYIPKAQEELLVYLPAEIPVGVGRTIELYNELVCINAEKYHLHYTCQIGIQYGRKFSITGTTAGNYTLTLDIFDDAENCIWTGQSTVKVIQNGISSEKKIIPIGDSLTNLKPWIGEVETLSNSKIKFIGTRGRNDQTIRHEGRSGFKAADYLIDSEYTYDQNYQGNPNVSGEVNPFWNGSRFSLSYYNTQQAATVGTADAIVLFLGTNDVFSGLYTAEGAAKNITDLIDNIRLDNASIPIFVCNTIYRSNQNGYYTSGGQGFTAISGWAFNSDIRIMEFQNALVDAIADKEYTNVYVTPLSVCMDREYDFGNVETPVNPRLSTVTINIPNESVHPQDAGYMQIADVMYSSIIAHLT